MALSSAPARFLLLWALMLCPVLLSAQKSWRVELGFSPDVALFAEPQSIWKGNPQIWPEPYFGFRLSTMATHVWKNGLLLRFGLQARRYAERQYNDHLRFPDQIDPANPGGNPGQGPFPKAHEYIYANYWMDIPLSVGYAKRWGNWELLTHAGLAFGFFLAQTRVTTVSYTSGPAKTTVYSESDWKGLAMKSLAQVYGLAGIGVNYHFANGLLLGLEPSFQINLSPGLVLPDQGNTWANFFPLVGAKVGLGYAFGNK